MQHGPLDAGEKRRSSDKAIHDLRVEETVGVMSLKGVACHTEGRRGRNEKMRSSTVTSDFGV